MNLVEFFNELKGTDVPLVDHYGDWLGYQILDYDLNSYSVRTTLEIRKEHLSPSNAVHGGVVSGYLDFSLGCAVFTTLKQLELASTVDLNVKYFKYKGILYFNGEAVTGLGVMKGKQKALFEYGRAKTEYKKNKVKAKSNVAYSLRMNPEDYLATGEIQKICT